MKIYTEIHQDHEAWHEMRSIKATASEFGKIFTGGGKVSTQREPYMRKCAIAREFKMPTWGGNRATDRGHELEPVARDLFRELSGLDVREVAFVEHENGLCGGSPDGLIYAPDDTLVSGLEIKCYNYDKHMGILSKRVLPTENKPQVHGAMFLAKVDSWQFMPYHDEAMPFDHCVIETTPDSYTDNLENEVMQFCEELDRRADEFISDFRKSIDGQSMRLAMPALFKKLEEGSII